MGENVNQLMYEHMLADRLVAAKGLDAFVSPVDSSKDRTYWMNVTRIALMRFSECQRGERIPVSEVKARLSQLRKAGYHVSGYSRMNSQEIWNYLMRTRAEIFKQAESYCPDVLEEIESQNQERKYLGRSHL